MRLENDGDGGVARLVEAEAALGGRKRYQRAEALIANSYLAGTSTRRVGRALGGLFGGKVG